MLPRVYCAVEIIVDLFRLIIALLWRQLADSGNLFLRLRIDRNLWLFDVKYASTIYAKYAAYFVDAVASQNFTEVQCDGIQADRENVFNDCIGIANKAIIIS